MIKKTTSDTKQTGLVITHKREVLVVILLHVVIAILIFAILLPRANALATNLSTLASVQEQNRLQEESIRQQQQAERAATDTLEAMSLEDAILEEKNAVQFIEQLEEIAAISAVDQQISFQHTARTQRGDMIIIPVAIQVTGTWTAVTEYLTTIEQSPFYINPTRLSLAQTINTDGETIPSIIMQANTYWLE